MAKELPFDEETMTLIMGLGNPNEPGEHGRKMVPAPDKTAIELITEIKDMCENFLMAAGKQNEEKKPEEKNESEDMGEEEE